jgi:segregation and condensation protein B
VEGLRQQLEALIFCAAEPIPLADLLACARKLHGEEVKEFQVVNVLDALIEHYEQGPHAFQVVAVAGGYCFRTKPDFKEAVTTLIAEQSRKKLSTSALETLSIIAYRQPITKAEIEAIRGVSADYALLKLLERGLVAMGGRKEAPGRPVLYSTTPKFLEHVGLLSLRDLPPVQEQTNTHELGEPVEVAVGDVAASAEDRELSLPAPEAVSD